MHLLTRLIRQADVLVENFRLIETVLEAWPEAAHWIERMSRHGIPCGKVRTLDEVYEDPQTLSQGLINVDHALLGSVRLPGPAIRLAESTPRPRCWASTTAACGGGSTRSRTGLTGSRPSAISHRVSAEVCP